MVRTETHKLSIDTLSRQPIDLYDLRDDPNELHNRLDDPGYQGIKEELIEQVLNPLLADLDTTTW